MTLQTYLTERERKTIEKFLSIAHEEYLPREWYCPSSAIEFLKKEQSSSIREAYLLGIEEVKKELENWTAFTCHTRKEHEDNDCPGWSHEDQETRKLVLEQILSRLETLSREISDLK